MQHQTNISGISIKYWVYNEDKIQTIVMVHGFTGSHEGFQYIVPLLSDYKVIVPDLPGFGVSDLPKRELWSINHVAILTSQFVDSLKLSTRPHLLGHSMGGLVASAMVGHRSDAFDRVILISPVPTKVSMADSRRAGAILTALQYRLGHRFKRLGQKLVRNRTISRAATNLIMTTTDKELQKEIHSHHYKNLDYISDVEYYSQIHNDINKQGAIEYADALSQKDLLLILGEKDSVTPLKHQRKLIEAISPTQLRVIENVGHLAHYEAPDQIAASIAAFLK